MRIPRSEKQAAVASTGDYLEASCGGPLDNPALPKGEEAHVLRVSARTPENNMVDKFDIHRARRLAELGVNCESAALGPGSPEGRLCAQMTALAP